MLPLSSLSGSPTATVMPSVDMDTYFPNSSPDAAPGITNPTIFYLFAVEEYENTLA